MTVFKSYKDVVATLFAKAGIQINGIQPWDILVNDERMYGDVIVKGSLGLGESYMAGWWDSKDLPETIKMLIQSDTRSGVLNLPALWLAFRSRLLNQQRRGSKSIEVARTHYDLSNRFFTSFLDEYNQYTCGYFKDTTDLDLAQRQKLDMICRKLQLKPEDTVLDIGCGWGGFCRYAAENYGCRLIGITNSSEQAGYARHFCANFPVEIRTTDYRDYDEACDKVLVCGMIEHVGYKNYSSLMKVVHRCLKDDGLFLLHTIGGNFSETTGDEWSNKYIFKNGMIPSFMQLSEAMEGLFMVEDLQNFGAYYVDTLLAWRDRLESSWSRCASDQTEEQHRMWFYYFSLFAGAFRARHLQLWHIVMSKHGGGVRLYERPDNDASTVRF